MELNQLHNFISETPLTQKMPVLFLGHGSPMNAIEENQFVQGFRNCAQNIPKPSAIICISAHWYTKGTKVTAMDFPPTIHDFGGFPEALYQVQYPVQGHSSLAQTTKHLLEPTPVTLDEHWGLDHGAWSVIKHLYPNADIPVIQLSIDYTQPPSYHFELAQKLHDLRNRGVLFIGSGNIIHNLRAIDFNNLNTIDYGYDWAEEAFEKINHLIITGDYQSLLKYEKLGHAVQLAIPTPDHYLPLLYSLGLQLKSDALHLFNNHLLAGSLSMTSIKIQ